MNKIKDAIDTIELPEELSRRSVMGVKKARKLQKSPSRNIFRYRAIFGGLAASLLFLGVLFTDFLSLGGSLELFQDTRVSQHSQDMVVMESVVVDDITKEGLAKVGTRGNLYRLVVIGENIYLEEVPYSNYLIINAFDLESPGEGLTVETFLGHSGENIVMFQDSFYIEVKEWCRNFLFWKVCLKTVGSNRNRCVRGTCSTCCVSFECSQSLGCSVGFCNSNC